jgi:hypothetical protein
MSAYEIPSLRFSLEASGIIARRRFVKTDANSKGLQAAAGEAAIGVSTNDTAVGEVLEMADGIVIVEAGGVVAANATIQSDASGRAVTRTTGLALGVALTPASAAGEFISVKMPGVSIPSNIETIRVPVVDLDAGGDLAAIPFYVIPTGFRYTVLSVDLVSIGNPAGIDNANTCVIDIKKGATSIATKTYNTATVFPAGGAADNLGVITNALRVAGDVLTYSVTNGATANPDAFVIQITGVIEAV